MVFLYGSCNSRLLNCSIVKLKVIYIIIWLSLSYEEIAAIFLEKNSGEKSEEGFDEAFGASLPEQINQNHELSVA